MNHLVFCLIALLLFPFTYSQQKENPSTLRALLIGGDTFVSQQNTYPIAQNNLKQMEALLSADTRTYARIDTYYDQIGTVSEFENAFATTFAHTDSNDLSLLYFSTHGILTEEKNGLILCRNETESILTPHQLSAVLDRIPGKKILILDACNSGSFIAKGIDSLAITHPFTGKNVYIITSAGGNEASWQWQSDSDRPVSGGSYFTTMLTGGLGGHHTADMNRDGIVTLAEAFGYLSETCASSTPQMYPQRPDEDVPLYTYNASAALSHTGISGLTFDDTILSARQSEVSFSFTLHQPAALYYQLVYYQNGQWDFANASYIQDTQEGSDVLSPGRKVRTLHLAPSSYRDTGYVMLQLFTLENEVPVYQGGRLLCVQPIDGRMSLSVTTAPSFHPEKGEEMSILVYHDIPCSLSVTVRSPAGKTIQTLCYDAPTRPQQLAQNASSFYWDGRNRKGEYAEPGLYYIQVQVDLGEKRYTAESAFFTLYSTQGED